MKILLVSVLSKDQDHYRQFSNALLHKGYKVSSRLSSKPNSQVYTISSISATNNVIDNSDHNETRDVDILIAENNLGFIILNKDSTIKVSSIENLTEKVLDVLKQYESVILS